MKEIYYTKCCGKYVEEKTVYKEKRYMAVGRYKGTGQYCCSRCKQKVTKIGG